MRKAYIFIYDDVVGDREKLKNLFNRMSTVKTWRFDMPHCFYVISENSAAELYEEFVSLNGRMGKFLFIEASENRQGQMIRDTWHLLRNKVLKSKQT
ncbi:hypothetical protein [Pseudomonas sp. SST3]|uniref:hypothetical protein n=1 Tax=Pseudomonas sp. SST3 TaxID=2267882 RepID=UPI000E001DEA|nr:hypothetical protein [Pseudomonas sp. SST3]NKQ09214.1 hypothetical protein [Pseudomonas sp. SST3]